MRNMNPTKEILTKKISECYESPFKEFLTSLIKPAINIKLSRENPAIIGFSKMGGVPLIEKGEVWPRSKNDGPPLLFLLQIDLIDLTEFDIENDFPKEGLLSFYFSADSWEEGLVRFYDKKESLVLADLPEEYFAEEKRQKLPVWKRVFTRESLFCLFKEFKVEFELEYQIPNYDSVQVELYEKRNSKRIYDFQTNDHLIEKYFLDNDGFGMHHLLGYYSALQDSKYELARVHFDWFQRKSSVEADLKEAQKWRILLKLGSDNLTGMNWVDAGHLFFFIKHNDLENRKFDNIKAYLDTT